MKKKLYLASPYGFSEQTNNILLNFKNLFLESGLEVFEPFEEGNLIDKKGNWAYKIAKLNYDNLKKSDCIFAIVNGTPPDEGVMVEIGIAIALKKEIFLFRDDFRSCSDSELYPLNLMLFAGLPEDDWVNNYFISFDEITSLEKNFTKWLNKSS